MSPSQIIEPSAKLRTKFYYWVWGVFLLMLPCALLGLIPDIGGAFVRWFLLANAVWIVVAYALIPPYFRSISYEMGDEEVVVRKGILTKTRKVVPYRMVTNVSVKRGPLDRLFGLGSLELHTAGYSQQTGPEARLSGLADHEQVYQQLMGAIRRHRGVPEPSGATGMASAQAPMPSDADATALLRKILGELQAIRAGHERGQEG